MATSSISYYRVAAVTLSAGRILEEQEMEMEMAGGDDDEDTKSKDKYGADNLAGLKVRGCH